MILFYVVDVTVATITVQYLSVYFCPHPIAFVRYEDIQKYSSAQAEQQCITYIVWDTKHFVTAMAYHICFIHFALNISIYFIRFLVYHKTTNISGTMKKQ